jgi:hypothetical protein
MLWGSEDTCSEIEDIKIISASDLMSDVLAHTEPGSLLLSGLSNPQVIRTAEMVDVCAVCLVRGKRPEKATVELAKEMGIPLLSTKLPMYEACGRLYKHGLGGLSEVQEEM